MNQFKSIKEILEFAITREQESYQTYLSLMELAKDPDLYHTLESFAKDELQHKANLELELMKEGLTVDEYLETPEMDFSFENVASNFHIDTNYQKILLASIQKEKASFRLYVKLAGHVKEPELHETLLAMAEEEVKHKVVLEMKYEKLMKK
ncbi:MAG: ferritin family protein [Phycisphaerae bacterium]|nr:ferritin family protein [Phycisphaerae bacterium]